MAVEDIYFSSVTHTIPPLFSLQQILFVNNILLIMDADAKAKGQLFLGLECKLLKYLIYIIRLTDEF